jgi:hypothetical protein
MSVSTIKQKKLQYNPSQIQNADWDKVVASLNQVFKAQIEDKIKTQPNLDSKQQFLAQEKKYAMDFLVMNTPNLPQKQPSAPKEIVEKQNLFATCAHFLTNNADSKQQVSRTVTWCITDPSTDNCQISICFDVDEVRKYLSNNASLGANIPMFKRDAIIALINARFPNNAVEVLPFATDEFKAVIENFELIPPDFAKMQDAEASSHVDRLMLVVNNFVTDWFNENIKNSSNVFTGTFWKITQRATQLSKKALSSAFRLIHNPFWVLVITTVLKMTRMLLCLAMNIMNIKTIAEVMSVQLISILDATTSGLTKILLKFLQRAISFVSRRVEEWKTAGQTILDKVPSMLEDLIIDTSKTTLSVFNVVFKVVQVTFGYVFNSLYNFISGNTLIEFSVKLTQVPTNIKAILCGSNSVEVQTKFRDSLTKHSFQDLKRLALFVFLDFCPVAIMHKMLAGVLVLTHPKMKPIILKLQSLGADMNILVFFRYCSQSFADVFLVWAVFDELIDWLFDMIGCTMSFIVTYIYEWIHSDSSTQSSKLNTVCCTAKVIQDLTHTATATSYESTGLLSNVKNAFTRFFKNGTKQDEVPQLAMQTQELMASYPTESLFKDSSQTLDLLPQKNKNSQVIDDDFQVPVEYKTYLTSDAIEQNIAAKSRPSLLNRFWAATISDEREKSKVYDEPFYTMQVSDGNKVNFYIFTWKPDAMFFDNSKIHMSVLAQELQTMYPDAIFSFKNRLFVLFDRLPRDLRTAIIDMGNPVIDLNELLR